MAAPPAIAETAMAIKFAGAVALMLRPVAFFGLSRDSAVDNRRIRVRWPRCSRGFCAARFRSARRRAPRAQASFTYRHRNR